MDLPAIRHSGAARLGVLVTSIALIAALTPSSVLAGKSGGGSGGPQFPPAPDLQCGATITSSLQMTKNYNCSQGFIVTGSGITIDLAGYTVRVSAGYARAFQVNGSRVTIKNGTIVTDQVNYEMVGVYVSNGYDVTLSRLLFRAERGNTGIECKNGTGSVSLANVTMQGGNYGLDTLDCSVSITSSSASGAYYDGIRILRYNTGLPISATLSGVTATGNRVDGVHAERIPVTVSNSSFYLNGDDGIEHDGYEYATIKLSGSRMTDNGSYGAYLYQSYVPDPVQGSFVSSNSFLRNGYGIVLRFPGPSGAMTVKGNEASSNAGDGFYADYVTGTGVSSGNTARDNAGSGFYANASFASSSTDRCFGNGNDANSTWTCTLLSK